MDENEDRVLSAALRARIAVAKATLAERMSAAGLTESQGWKIDEEVRPAPFGTELVFRPMHMRLDAPDYEVIVQVTSDGVPL